MNTTTYERAKAYECVSQKVKDFFEGKQKMYSDVKQTLKYLFPELAVSEDERIRKELLEHCINRRDGKQVCVDASDYRRWADWLYRQAVENIPNVKSDKEITDNIEPKFKVGDWVVYNDANVYQVKEIDYTNLIPRYELKNVDRDKLSVPFTSDYNLKNWTIKDAKNGDVLITIDDKCPFIYKGCLDSKHPNFPVAYCGLDSEGCFCHNGDEFNQWWVDEEVQPAIKEQRDLLFQKMKEAGYSFDFETKELKKDEIKIKAGRNYRCTKTHIYAGLDWFEGTKYYAYEDYSLVNNGCTCFCPKGSKYEHNNLFEEVEYDGCVEKQGEQKHVDSYCEENCKGFQETGKCYADGECKAKREAEQNPAWSDDDEKMMQFILKYVNASASNFDYQNIQIWFRNIKNRVQPHWKPTEEQLMALRDAIDNNEMESLYNDLKKL